MDSAVRGMMYYWRALKLQAFLDMADEEGKAVIDSPSYEIKNQIIFNLQEFLLTLKFSNLSNEMMD